MSDKTLLKEAPDTYTLITGGSHWAGEQKHPSSGGTFQEGGEAWGALSFC